MKILFFDTETTGLPKNWKAPVHQLDNWPRLVQIAWQVYSSNGDLLEEHDYVIKPVGFIIPAGASAVHKITTEKALEIGSDLLTILNIFSSSANACGLLVAHNYSYDYNIMGSELLRNGLENSLYEKEHICTMNASTEFCKIPGPYGYKWPKLEELYDILFRESFNAHDALDDIKATARCFWELSSLKVIMIPKTKISQELEYNKKEDNKRDVLELKKSKILNSSQNISAQLIIHKIGVIQQDKLNFLSSHHSFFKISSAGKAEHLLYYYYYVIHSLHYTQKSYLKPRKIVGQSGIYNVFENEEVIKLNDGLITELLTFLKHYLTSECTKLGIKNSESEINNFITNRFALYKFSDEQFYQDSMGGGRINSDVIRAVYHNPLKTSVIVQSDGTARHVTGPVSERERFNKSNCRGLDDITDLLTLLGIDHEDHQNLYDQKFKSIKVEDYIDKGLRESLHETFFSLRESNGIHSWAGKIFDHLQLFMPNHKCSFKCNGISCGNKSLEMRSSDDSEKSDDYSELEAKGWFDSLFSSSSGFGINILKEKDTDDITSLTSQAIGDDVFYFLKKIEKEENYFSLYEEHGPNTFCWHAECLTGGNIVFNILKSKTSPGEVKVVKRKELSALFLHYKDDKLYKFSRSPFKSTNRYKINDKISISIDNIIGENGLWRLTNIYFFENKSQRLIGKQELLLINTNKIQHPSHKLAERGNYVYEYEQHLGITNILNYFTKNYDYKYCPLYSSIIYEGQTEIIEECLLFQFLNVSIHNEILHLNLRNEDNIKSFGGVFGIRNDNPLPYKDLNILDIDNKKSTHNLYKVLEGSNEFAKEFI